MKTILYLRTDLGTQDLTSGGSVTHTLGVLDGLLSQKKTIYCASSAMHSLLKSKKGISFIPLSVPKIVQLFGFKISCLISNGWFLCRVLLFLRSKRIDYIYQRYSMLNCLGALIAKIKNVPLVLEFNGSEAWVDAHWSPNKKLNANRLVAWFERHNTRSADYIIVVSQVLKDMLIAQGVEQQKILVNPNGVDVQQFDPDKYQDKRKALRNSLGIADKYVFGFIGSFSYWHGIGVISAIIPRIVAQYPRAHFLLIGSGPLFGQFKNDVAQAGVADSVTCIGNVPYAQAPEYLSACDAYLCPSQPNADGTPFFGSPTKLFEYMSMAKPIIASDVDQLRDIVDPSFGMLVPPDDIDGFVTAALHLIEHDIQEQKTMGKIARDATVQRFSWCQHVNNIQKFIS